jgi:hypothetical protein
MSARVTLISLVLVAVSSPVVFETAGSGAVGGEADLCFGQVPTIVGMPGEPLSGTEGSDVVVINEPLGRVYTGAGDDLVCFTSGGAAYTGAGNDRVDASASTGEPYAYTVLGRGSDEYIGGAFVDQVIAGDDHGHDTSVDVISTGGSKDFVETDGGADVVDLGSSGDHLEVRGDASGAVFAGGGGRNWLHVDLIRLGSDSWMFDNRAERILRDAQPFAQWQGFTHFEVAARGPITFLGSELGESLAFKRLYGNDIIWLPPQPLDVRMRGGDDIINFYGGAAESRFDGGQGTDKVAYQVVNPGTATQRTVQLDLSSGMLRDVTNWGKRTIRRVADFENATVKNLDGEVVITGTSEPNVLKMNSGDLAATINGLAGGDVMAGSYGDDVLIGGPGYDQANGAWGTDRCEAEVETACEQ